jgi:hypothetical protein
MGATSAGAGLPRVELGLHFGSGVEARESDNAHRQIISRDTILVHLYIRTSHRWTGYSLAKAVQRS